MGLILAGAREHELPRAWIAHLERFELAVDESVGQRVFSLLAGANPRGWL